MNRTIVLNSDYTFLNTVSWKKAVKMIVKEKVEVIKSMSKTISSGDKSYQIPFPAVIRLIKMVRVIYKAHVPFNKRNVFIRDGHICKYCGKRPEQLTIDHVIPKCKGGKSTFENCVSSCKPCNNFKNNRTPSEANMKIIGKLPWQPTIMEFIRIRMKGLEINDLLKDLGVY